MRYSRQEIMSEIGTEGQRRLSLSNVVVVGAGAIGSVSADLLVRAGLNVRIIDRDFIELSNIQRSGIFREADIGHPKASRAADILREINSTVKIEGIDSDVNSSNIEEIIGSPDVVLDATDNMRTRFLINDYCKSRGIPWIYAGGVGREGMVMVIRDGPCLRCVMPDSVSGTDTCDTRGVLNTTTHMVAAIQVNEALKIILGKPASERLICVDMEDSSTESVQVSRRDGCPTCAGTYEYLESSAEVTEMCGSSAYHIRSSGAVDLKRMCARLDKLGEAMIQGSVMHARVEGHEITVFADGRVIVKADSKSAAKSIYDRFMG